MENDGTTFLSTYPQNKEIQVVLHKRYAFVTFRRQIIGRLMYCLALPGTSKWNGKLGKKTSWAVAYSIRTRSGCAPCQCRSKTTTRTADFSCCIILKSFSRWVDVSWKMICRWEKEASWMVGELMFHVSSLPACLTALRRSAIDRWSLWILLTYSFTWKSLPPLLLE